MNHRKKKQKQSGLSAKSSETLKNAAIGAIAGAAGAVFAKAILGDLAVPKSLPAGVPTGPASVDELIYEMTPEEQMEVLRRVLGDDLVETLTARVTRRRAQLRLAGESKPAQTGPAYSGGAFSRGFGGES